MNGIDTCYRYYIGDEEDGTLTIIIAWLIKSHGEDTLWMGQASNAYPLYLKQIRVQNGSQTHWVP